MSIVNGLIQRGTASPSNLRSVPTSPEAGLKLQDVTLVYEGTTGPLTALENLSLHVAPGEFVSVVGPSGCGKSSLLKLASGLLRPTTGRITLAGNKVDKPRPDVGIVFQQPTLLPWKTVLDNVLVPIRAMRLGEAEYRPQAEALLKLVGLEKFKNSYPRELSGGMQQRVAIARGLIHNPSLLLMDEPFSALDAMTREQMMDELQRIWASSKKSVLFITHSIQEAIYLSDRIVVMKGRPGQVIEEIHVTLPRPRTQADLGNPYFIDLANHLRDKFHTMHQEA